ncbi:MAG: hypothetical protein IKQ75_08630 [Bacteroidales bacterium]|nr:hypothetical protein [Bacteroidales bacterium]
MRKNIAIFILVLMGCIPLSLSAQTPPPAWLSPAVREMEYPTDTYFSEFTEGNLHPNENISALLDRLKSDAKRGAAGSIRTLINSVVEKTDRQDAYGHDFRFSSVYQDYTRQIVNADIVGIHTESYYNEGRKWGYAFAYVRRTELATYYRAQIALQLRQLENALALSTTLVNDGEKAQARKVCEEALQPLTQIEFAQDLLTAVCPDDTTGMQLPQLFRLKKELFQTLVSLGQSIYIYLQCSESNFGQPVRILEPEMKRILAKEQCSFTEDPDEADFIITITASTRQHEGNVAFGDGTFKFSYADIEIEVYSNCKKRQVYNGSVTVKNNGDVATYESAGRNALKLSASKVWDEMKPWIQGQ